MASKPKPEQEPADPKPTRIVADSDLQESGDREHPFPMHLDEPAPEDE